MSVLIAGSLLALAVLIVAFLFIVNSLPENFNPYAYFLLKALVGASVGLFVGFVQRKKGGLIAVICLMPTLLLQLTSRTFPVRTGRAFAALFVSEALGMLVAFVIASRLSDSITSRARSDVSGI
ncbi:MAG TPA: hypothetical protein VE263_16395 [Candidatus Angelobacter sp.]|nr:hypothetical protein [Candidatus Angelobacter sp.]